MEDKLKLFTLLVVGDNPDEMIKKYDSSLEVEPYIKYYYNDKDKYRKQAIKIVKELLKNDEKLELTEFMKDYFEDKISALNNTSDLEYYSMLAKGCTYDSDGNILSTENPDGKWSSCRIGRNLCIPFVLKDGTTSLQAKAGDIDWSKMHMVNVEVYETAWDLFYKEREPVTDLDKQIYENIKDKKNYFKGFSSREDYVNYCCSYWCYAYLDENGWVDADSHKDYKWITEFYDKFISGIKEDKLLTLYECSK